MNDEDRQQSVLALSESVGPATAYLARRLLEQATREACHRCTDLLCYARRFSPLRVERAAVRLIGHGLEDLRWLQFLLEQDLDGLVDRPDAEVDGQLSLGLAGVGPSNKREVPISERTAVRLP